MCDLHDVRIYRMQLCESVLAPSEKEAVGI